MNKLIQFTLLIPVSNRLREFNFRKRSEELYDANMADERGSRYYFKLAQKNGQWEVVGEEVPDWLKESGHSIIEALLKYNE